MQGRSVPLPQLDLRRPRELSASPRANIATPKHIYTLEIHDANEREDLKIGGPSPSERSLVARYSGSVARGVGISPPILFDNIRWVCH